MIQHEDLINNRKKILYILFVNIFTLWISNIHTTHINKYLPDSLYYAKSLSIYYWLGITLILIVFILNIYIEEKSIMKAGELNNLLLIAFTILYLYGTTSFIYSNPRILDVYVFSDIIDKIDMFKDGLIKFLPMYKTQFQASTLFFSIISKCSGITALTIAKYYPIYMMSVISILLYSTAKEVSSKYYVIVPIAYLSLGWLPEYNLAPQSIALLLTINLQLLFVNILNNNNNLNNVIKIFLAIIIWITICLSHALTPIMNLITIISIALVNIFLKNKNKIHTKNTATEVERVLKLIYLYSVIYIGYLAYKSSFIIKRMVSTLRAIIYNINSENVFVVVDRNVIEPSDSYLLAYKIRMLTIAITIIIGILFSLIILRSREKKPINTYMSGLFFGYASFGIALVVTGFNIYGASRSYIFLLIPYSILCLICMEKLLKSERNRYLKLLMYSAITFIILSIIIFPITCYATDPYNFVSESEYAGKNFCLKYNNGIDYKYDNMQALYPVSPKYAYHTNYYNFIEMKSKKGKEYTETFNGYNIIYNSGQYKTSMV